MNVLKCSCCSSTILEVFKGLTPPTTDTRYVDRYPWTHIQKAPFKLWKWKCPKMEVAPNRPSSNYFEHWHCCWIPPLDCGRPDLLEDIYQSGDAWHAIGSSGHTLPRTLASWSKECPQRNGRSTSVVIAIPMGYATWLAETLAHGIAHGVRHWRSWVALLMQRFSGSTKKRPGTVTVPRYSKTDMCDWLLKHCTIQVTVTTLNQLWHQLCSQSGSLGCSFHSGIDYDDESLLLLVGMTCWLVIQKSSVFVATQAAWRVLSLSWLTGWLCWIPHV